MFWGMFDGLPIYGRYPKAKTRRRVPATRAQYPVAPMPDVGGFLECMEKLIEAAIAEGDWEE